MHSARVLTVSLSMLCSGGAPEGGVPGPGGVYLVPGGGWGGGVPGPGDVPGPRGVYLVPGGCIWSQGVVSGPRGVYLVLGGVPGPRGCTWSQEGAPGPRGCTWSRGYLVPGMYLVLGGVPGLGGCTWSRGVYLVPGVYLVLREGVRYSPPVNGITHTCKNITLSQLRCGRLKYNICKAILCIVNCISCLIVFIAAHYLIKG